MLTSAEVALALKITPRRVRALYAAGILRGRKLGRDLRIHEESVEAAKGRSRKGGRPRKAIAAK